MSAVSVVLGHASIGGPPGDAARDGRRRRSCVRHQGRDAGAVGAPGPSRADPRPRLFRRRGVGIGPLGGPPTAQPTFRGGLGSRSAPAPRARTGPTAPRPAPIRAISTSMAPTRHALEQAIDAVIASYPGNPLDQVLVQPDACRRRLERRRHHARHGAWLALLCPQLRRRIGPDRFDYRRDRRQQGGLGLSPRRAASHRIRTRLGDRRDGPRAGGDRADRYRWTSNSP